MHFRNRHNRAAVCIKFCMHDYRYQTGKKKKLNNLPVFFILGITVVLLIFGRHKGSLSRMKEAVEYRCYEALLNLYMPGSMYSANEAEKKTAVEHLLAYIFPLGDIWIPETAYPTQVESALSYEIILAREAADENYVDAETGELVLAGEDTVKTGEDTGNTGSAGDYKAGAGNTENGQSLNTGSGNTWGNGGEGNSMSGENTAETGTGSEEVKQAATGGTGQKQVTYSREKLNDFDYLIQNFYQVDNTTTINGSQLNAKILLEKDMSLSQKVSDEASADTVLPQILIYHTHSQEGYADSVAGEASMSVVGVGDYLTKILTEQYGLKVLHHTEEYDVGDRDHAYAKAGPALEQVLKENPSVEVVIDLHRDGVREGTRLVTEQNGVKMAQIMFFNGLSRTTSTGDIGYLKNPYIEDNLALSFQMQLAAAEYYPGYTRRIYLKGYRYNMHYCPKTLLIEVGAQTNTLEEAMNAMVPLADILNKVLTGEGVN